MSLKNSNFGSKDRSDNLSDSDGSAVSYGSGNFASKKLNRKRGHAGKLISGGSNKDSS